MLLTTRQSDWMKGVSAVLLGLLSSIIIVSGLDTPVAYLGNRIVEAINCGGKQHTDIHGIAYRSDPLAGKVGVASDYGSRLIIQRIHPADMVLLQTERYHTDDFSYDIRMSSEKNDGDYVLVMKFCEVYFNSPGQKVFSVMLNDEHRVVSDLDIFTQAGGLGIAHDEVVPFSISDGKLRVLDQVSDFNGRLRVTFLKGEQDNPKINAFYILKGTVDEVPELLPLGRHDEEEHDVDVPEPSELDPEDEQARKARLASGPKAPDPYASQDHSQMFLPILIALACFFPVLFCLCKL
uniref:Malectin domain-containing protein n=1 Tax=Plectus sambesii TaxID=2011161 RepID=A0A914WWI0_9BILA